MKKALLIIVLLLVSRGAYAQTALTDQIDAVSAAQDQNEAVDRAIHQAYQQRMEAQQKAAIARADQQHAAAIAVAKQKEAEAAADKKRDQTYEDQLRALHVQEKSLQVESEKAHVTRENEFINQELKEKAAETDVIKSQADSTRDLSEGEKTLLEKTGEAEVKSQSGLLK